MPFDTFGPIDEILQQESKGFSNKSQSAFLRLIGDVHGVYHKYKELIQGAEYTLQVGDMGLDYAALESVDSTRNKFFPGNHDNYDTIADCPNALGDYGVWSIPDFGEVFWVRGGFSIDKKYRHEYDYKKAGLLFKKNWWREEEMTLAQCEGAIDLYTSIKPDFLVSHECPEKIVPYVTDPNFVLNFGFAEPLVKTRTNQLLQALTEIHPPKLHIFGHYHRNFSKFVNGKTGEYDESSTHYVCVATLNAVDVTPDLTVRLL